jgi:hypothetical protein
MFSSVHEEMASEVTTAKRIEYINFFMDLFFSCLRDLVFVISFVFFDGTKVKSQIETYLCNKYLKPPV